MNTDVFLHLELGQYLHILKLKYEGGPKKFFDNISTIQIQARKINDGTISEK